MKSREFPLLLGGKSPFHQRIFSNVRGLSFYFRAAHSAAKSRKDKFMSTLPAIPGTFPVKVYCHISKW